MLARVSTPSLSRERDTRTRGRIGPPPYTWEASSPTPSRRWVGGCLAPHEGPHPHQICRGSRIFWGLKASAVRVGFAGMTLINAPGLVAAARLPTVVARFHTFTACVVVGSDVQLCWRPGTVPGGRCKGVADPVRCRRR